MPGKLTPSTIPHTHPHNHEDASTCGMNRYQPPVVEGAIDSQRRQLEDAVRAAGSAEQLLYGIEVVQAVQNMNHSVPLVADKPTLVRVYLKYPFPVDVKISGVIRATWRANDGVPSKVIRNIASTDYLKVQENTTQPLNEQRKDLQNSLNFVLPDVMRRAGECQLQLIRLEVHLPVSGSSFKIPIEVPPNNISTRKVQFQTTPPLRVHLLGIRYGDSQGNIYEPSGTDYTLIQSWLKRAYPVADVRWSHLVVDAPQAWPFDAGIINAFIRGIRRRDVQNGTDVRTHYYGLVSNGAGFMRGLASGIPDAPDPSTVASGPTGPNWSWDKDGSYGDWYTGHELGHTFGRYHAEFCGASGGQPYPFENGQLSNADEEFVGFDFGDASNNALPMRSLPGVLWHDVMSYCDNQWLSSFTYTGIRDRLIAEDSLVSTASQGVSRESTIMSANSIQVLATVNLTRKTGVLQHVTASSTLPPDVPESMPDQAPDLKLRLYREDGQLVGEFPVNFYPDACREVDADETGIVDVVIPSTPDAAAIELVLEGQAIDTFTRTTTAQPVQNVRAVTPPQEFAIARSEIPTTVSIEWNDASTESGARALDTAPGVSYIVQISKDNGETWQTVGFDLDRTKLDVDPSLLEDADQIQVRVTSTDGFTAHTVTQNLNLTAE